jgi:hypothetical protein
VQAPLHHHRRHPQNHHPVMALLHHRLRQLPRLLTTERFPHPPACKCGATTMISRLRQPFNLT